jgi:3-hydroxy acid dehydrogenase/malonic semialdehyde reductase
MDLYNKIILITGASAGIGEATAALLAAKGAKLILVARRLERLKALQKELPTQTYIAQVDLSKTSSIDDFLTNLPVEWQAIYGLVNNAGLAAGTEWLIDLKDDNCDQMIDVNIKGLLKMTTRILPLLLKQESAHIVNLASISGHGVYAGGVVYCATKHAVRAITKGLRLECFEKNVRITEISPGAVETEFSLVRFSQDEKKAKAVYEGYQPLLAEDIADAIIYAMTRPLHVNIDEMIIMPLAQAAIGKIAKK